MALHSRRSNIERLQFGKGHILLQKPTEVPFAGPISSFIVGVEDDRSKSTGYFRLNNGLKYRKFSVKNAGVFFLLIVISGVRTVVLDMQEPIYLDEPQPAHALNIRLNSVCSVHLFLKACQQFYRAR